MDRPAPPTLITRDTGADGAGLTAFPRDAHESHAKGEALVESGHQGALTLGLSSP